MNYPSKCFSSSLYERRCHVRTIITRKTNPCFEYITQVCLSMLDEWTGDMDLEDIVMGLLFLMQNPQIDDPLNGNFRGDEKYPDFVRKVHFTQVLHKIKLE